MKFIFTQSLQYSPKDLFLKKSQIRCSNYSRTVSSGYTELDDRRMNLRLACALLLTFAVMGLIFGILYSSLDSFAFLPNYYADTNNNNDTF